MWYCFCESADTYDASGRIDNALAHDTPGPQLETPTKTNPPASADGKSNGIRGDLAGGLAAAMIALPHALGNGALVFLPLGVVHLHLGISAGLSAAIVGALISTLFGHPRYQVLSGSTTTSVILASLVATLATNPVFMGGDGLRVDQITAMVFVAVFLGGVVQLFFALFRLGRALKFIPQPVLVGFMCGVALQLFLQQLKPLLGIGAEVPLHQLPMHLHEIQPWSVAVGAVTIIVALRLRQLPTRLPATMIAMVAGMVIFAVLRGSGVPGDVLGAFYGSVLSNSPVPVFLLHEWGEIWGQVWVDVCVTAMLIATAGAVLTLLSAAVLDAATGSKQEGDRTILTQGVSNIFSAALGGIFVGGANVMSLANFQNGGRTALSGITLSLIFVGILFGGGVAFNFVPVAALAGIMIVVALNILEDLHTDLGFRAHGSKTFANWRSANTAIIFLVGATTAFVNIVAAAIIGVIASSILLVARISATNIYRLSDGKSRSSIKARAAAQRGYLHGQGGSIGIVELSGYIFFGTAAKIRAEIEHFAVGRRVIILDFRRVYDAEANGMRELMVLARSLEGRGILLALSHVGDQLSAGLFLGEPHGNKTETPRLLFEDLDAALEWAEEELLVGAGKHIEASAEIALNRAELFEEFDDVEMACLQTMLRREELAKGRVIFREGDIGDRLFVITRGEVSINFRVAGISRLKRLAAFGPGMSFGEMALLEGKSRSADASVISEAVVFSLDAVAFSKLQTEHEVIAFKIVKGLARQLASRLRNTTEQLRGSN